MKVIYRVGDKVIVFGIELKASEAVIVIVEYENSLFTVKKYQKVPLNSINQSDARSFRDIFLSLIDEYSPIKLFINSRPKKGDYAGGAMTFIMEGILLTIESVEIVSIFSQTLSAQIKSGKIQAGCTQSPLYTNKAYQLALSGALEC